jgi:hypothetical protein
VHRGFHPRHDERDLLAAQAVGQVGEHGEAGSIDVRDALGVIVESG